MRVVFACAGTGGHVNPAIAIAKIIQKNEPSSKFLFIGTKDGLENKLVQNAGYDIVHISTGKLLRELTLKNFKAIFDTYRGIGQAKKILQDFKPDLVVGTGGYICGPVMLASKKLKIPYILHESNAFPGISTKLLAKNASKVMISFEDARARLKNRKNIVYTGTPAKFNKEEYDLLDKNECKKELGLEKVNKKIVLVTCGSQGAKKINETVMEMVAKFKNQNYFVILVTGQRTYDEFILKKAELEEEHKINLDNFMKIENFVFDMDKMYKASDICVVRGGAMTITELEICKKAAIIIPLPTAAENHQYYNAKVLENKNAAILLEQKYLTSDVLEDKIVNLLSNDKFVKMGENARKGSLSDVENKIYKCIKETV